MSLGMNKHAADQTALNEMRYINRLTTKNVFVVRRYIQCLSLVFVPISVGGLFVCPSVLKRDHAQSLPWTSERILSSPSF